MLPEHTRSVKLFCQIDPSAFASVMIVLVFTVMSALWLTPPHHGYGPISRTSRTRSGCQARFGRM